MEIKQRRKKKKKNKSNFCTLEYNCQQSPWGIPDRTHEQRSPFPFLSFSNDVVWTNERTNEWKVDVYRCLSQRPTLCGAVPYHRPSDMLHTKSPKAKQCYPSYAPSPVSVSHSHEDKGKTCAKLRCQSPPINTPKKRNTFPKRLSNHNSYSFSTRLCTIQSTNLCSIQTGGGWYDWGF